MLVSFCMFISTCLVIPISKGQSLSTGFLKCVMLKVVVIIMTSCLVMEKSQWSQEVVRQGSLVYTWSSGGCIHDIIL